MQAPSFPNVSVFEAICPADPTQSFELIVGFRYAVLMSTPPTKPIDKDASTPSSSTAFPGFGGSGKVLRVALPNVGVMLTELPSWRLVLSMPLVPEER